MSHEQRQAVWRWVLPVLLFANGIAILLFWWKTSGYLFASPMKGSVLIAFGRVTGLMAQYLLLMEVVLIGRIHVLEEAFGFPVLNRLHQTVGKWLLAFIVVHPLLLASGYAARTSRGVWGQLLDFVQNWEHVFGAVIGLSVIVIAGLLSFRFIKKHLRFETWYGTHLLMYVGIALIFRHQLEGGDMAHPSFLQFWLALNGIGFGFVLLYRFLRPFLLWLRHRFTVADIRLETPNVVSLTLAGRAMDRFRLEPGQYANFHFFGLAPRWASHPFSFSAIPNGKSLRISVKQLGDFTNLLPRLKIGSGVIIDGPLGRFTLSAMKTNKCLFIAGGIGITPIRALLDEAAKQGREAILLYAARTPADLVFRSEIDAVAHAHPNIRAMYIVESQEGDQECLMGRVDEACIRKYVSDPAAWDAYVCGPPAMMDGVMRVLRKVGMPKRQIHSERFSW